MAEEKRGCIGDEAEGSAMMEELARLDRDRFADVRAALSGITPLPWTADEQELFIFARGATEHGFETMVADDGGSGGYRRAIARIRGFGGGEPQERNLHAIATVMNAAPKLLVEIDALQGQIDRTNREKMPCGHFAVFAHSDDGKAVYCALCRIERLHGENDDLKREAARWRFAPDARGGHMLSVATGDKWYPESLYAKEAAEIRALVGPERCAKCGDMLHCSGEGSTCKPRPNGPCHDHKFTAESTIAAVRRQVAAEYVRGREHEQAARRVALSSFPREQADVMLALDEALNREAAIRAVVGASNLCALQTSEGPCGRDAGSLYHRCTCEQSKGHEPMWACHVLTPETTLAAVQRMAAMVVTDAACANLATTLAKEVACGAYLGDEEFDVPAILMAIKQARGTKERTS